MKIAFIGHSHHRVTQSSRFFFDILTEMGQVESFWDETWRGEDPFELTRIAEEAELIVVWQSVSYIKRIAELRHPNVVYAPMYDATKDLRRSFWTRLNGIKILNFSSTLHQRVQQFGCRNSAYFQYFPDPDRYRPTSDFDHLRGFFWQRQPRPSWQDIKQWIGPEFESFHLHLAADPSSPKPMEPNAEERRLHRIEVSRWFTEKTELLERVAASNVYFAPRLHEGIGLSFLEAMAMGMAVCAHDSPTHNEYIVDGVNGFLYSLSEPARPDWRRAREMGRRGRISVEKGWSRWHADRGRLLEFLARPPGRGPLHYARSSPEGKAANENSCNRDPAHGPMRPAAVLEGGSRLSVRPSVPPRVTIATVVRNARRELASTLTSVLAQSYGSKEIVVIDGGSSDGTLDILAAYGHDIDYWRSEKDQGPYDAMNKAADLARGHWILYINAGDSFVDEDALARFVGGVPEHADFVVGHHVYLSSDGVEEIHRCIDFETTYRRLRSGCTDGRWLSGIPGHQATLTRVDLIREHRYNLEYPIAADHEFMYRMRGRGASFHVEPVILSQYIGGGFSSQNLFRCVEEWRRIALRHTGNPQAVQRHFARLFFDTLRYSRRMHAFDWRQAPIRRHPLLAATAEIEHWLRWLLDCLDDLYAGFATADPHHSGTDCR